VTKQNKPLSVCELIENWLVKLATHFNVELDEDQIKIFTNALKSNSRYQIEAAFERCLNECEFMPKLAQVHDKMPEQRQDSGSRWEFILREQPILDVIRPIAAELCKATTGRNYEDLDALLPADSLLIHDLFARANRIRYERAS
jgi:hypothetical protein